VTGRRSLILLTTNEAELAKAKVPQGGRVALSLALYIVIVSVAAFALESLLSLVLQSCGYGGGRPVSGCLSQIQMGVVAFSK
jgi:hypothetical protein